MTNNVKHATIRRRIEEVGIIPSVRTTTAEGARFAAETVAEAGIPVVEITMTVPHALEIISELRKRHHDNVIVGADSDWDLAGARRAVDAGAMFLTSPGLGTRSILKFVVREDIVVIPGALTPTEVSIGWRAGGDFIKVFPCAAMGGPRYIRSLQEPFPEIPLIASGGVNQANAADYLASGAVALGIGGELIPKEAVAQRNASWITELARRFLTIVKDTRATGAQPEGQ